jgi:hypothetical protein
VALLDFIQNRNQQSGPSQDQNAQMAKPQTAREMYAAQDAQEQTNRKPLTPGVKSQADQVMEAVGKHQFQEHGGAATGNRESHDEPMRQNAVNQDKTAHALSPTTEQVGKVADSQTAPSPNRATPDDIVAEERMKATEKSRQQAPSQQPRPERGGWER